MRKFAFSVVLVCVALSGCTRSAHLYPANDIATATGVLTADFKSYGSGHGDIKVIMPDGELLIGEYSLVRGGTIGFGNVYGSVYGSSGLSSFSGNSSSYVMPGGSPGTASLFGDKGTSMLCEFYNDNFSGHGNGGCKSSRNALYRLQF